MGNGRSGAGFVAAMLAATAVAMGCQTPPAPSEADRAAQERLQRLGPEVKRLEHKSFDLRRACPAGCPQVEVRFAGKADLPPDTFPANALEGAGSGAAFAGVGILATVLTPMAQGAAAGGIIGGPILLVLGIRSQVHANAVQSALEDVDLPAALQRTTLARLGRQYGGEVQRDCRVQVLILTYGFVEDGYTGRSVFTFDAALRVVASDAIVFEDKLLIGPFVRSDDVPPPHRAAFDEFGAEGGAVARRTLQEAAEIMAAVIAARLEGTP